jgi:outer membrane protein assembly factor BamD
MHQRRTSHGLPPGARSALLARTLALSLSLPLLACAGGRDSIDITKPVKGDAATNAEKAYARGMEERHSASYLEATRYFEFVRNNFPYSQYAALSELALADMAFERDDFIGAAAAYGEFVKSHPSHAKADYAAYRVGLSHYTDRPSDLFLLPPPSEKDQGPVRLALESFERFVRGYPKSELLNEAKSRIGECRKELASHEQFVAEFYWKKSAWKGSAGRFLLLADQFGDLENGQVKSEALWRAGQAMERAGLPEQERSILERLVAESPGSEHRARAIARLTALPAKPKPPEAPVPPATEPGSASPTTTAPVP